ncbi:MAG TPA: sugar phosphate isomerase/epimerase [Terriglobales bacterium]|nr:sugar phosphate isomerase/epimerase [Terriglobales bacterium]
MLARREFLVGMGAMAAATLVPSVTASANAGIRIGYAAITWGGNDRQAIEDIAALGFHGIQLRSNCIQEFRDPAELRDLLAKHELKFVALSSGNLRLDRAVESEEIAKHVANAKFLRDAGGMYLQVIDERPKGRATTVDDCLRLGDLLTKLGKRTADLGIPLGYHNHMGSLGEHPQDVDRIMQAVDPRYAKLELDVAHYFQGGGNPATAIKKYHDRLLFLHIKDVERIFGKDDPKQSYRFVELGRGRINIPAIFEALRDVKFRGWTIVELDEVTDKARTPKDSAEINKKYLEEKLKIAI